MTHEPHAAQEWPQQPSICKHASDKLHLDVNDMKRSNAASIPGAYNLVYSKLPAGKISTLWRRLDGEAQGILDQAVDLGMQLNITSLLPGGSYNLLIKLYKLSEAKCRSRTKLAMSFGPVVTVICSQLTAVTKRSHKTAEKVQRSCSPVPLSIQLECVCPCMNSKQITSKISGQFCHDPAEMAP